MKNRKVLCFLLSLTLVMSVSSPVGSYAELADGELLDVVIEAEDDYLDDAPEFFDDGTVSDVPDDTDDLFTDDDDEVLFEDENDEDWSGTVLESETEEIITGTSAAVEITGQPADVTIVEGETAAFTVVAEGNGLTYQWQWMSRTGTTWANTGLPGAKTDTLTISHTVRGFDGRKYRCIVTDGSGTAIESDPATLTVEKAAGIRITGQPADVTIEEGETAIFAVAAEGDGLTYQWQWISRTGTTWANTGLPGAKTDTLTIANAIRGFNGRKYRCIVTDGSGNVKESDPATLTVEKAGTVKITGQPENASVTEGETAVFTVSAEGNDLRYQWQWMSRTGTTWANTALTGAKTDTLTIANAVRGFNGRKYRCIVTDGSGNVKESDPATLTVEKAGTVKITGQPADITIVEGETAVFTVSAEGNDLRYQWQWMSRTGTTWANTALAGAKTDTLTISNAVRGFNGRRYRCIVTDGNGNVKESDPATLTVERAATVEITGQPEDAVIEEGDTATFTVAAEGEDLTYQWQWMSRTGTTWANTALTGAKTDTLTISNAVIGFNGRKYRCIVTDGSGAAKESEPATLTVEKAVVLEITGQPEDITVEEGETATFTVAAVGKDLTYQWQWMPGTGTDWADTELPGAQTDTLTVPNVTKDLDGGKYRCIVTDKKGAVLESDPAVLSVLSGIVVNNVVYKLEDGIMSVIGYEGSYSDYVVEEVVNGYTVTRVGDSAFEGNTDLVSIDLPDSIEVIGKRAFANCSNLSSMR